MNLNCIKKDLVNNKIFKFIIFIEKKLIFKYK